MKEDITGWTGPFNRPELNAADRARQEALLVDPNDQMSALTAAVDAAFKARFLNDKNGETAKAFAETADRPSLEAEYLRMFHIVNDIYEITSHGQANNYLLLMEQAEEIKELKAKLRHSETAFGRTIG